MGGYVIQFQVEISVHAIYKIQRAPQEVRGQEENLCKTSLPDKRK